MPDSYTIAAAARLCGVARRTLQRAIQTGRLTLTAEHRLTLEALAQAGYAAATDRSDTPVTPQRRTTATDHRNTAETPQRQAGPLSPLLAPLIERLDMVIALLERLADQPRTAATPQRRTTAVHRSDTAATAAATPQVTPQGAYDPTRYRLGQLCPRGHDYQGSGQSLRRRHNGTCAQCEIEQQRARRRAQRQ